MSASQLALFLPVALLLAMAPGPDNLGVLALAVSSGRRMSLGFALGCASGCLNHTLLSMIGVAALIAASPIALQVLKTCGALYLTWIGWQGLRQLRRSDDGGPIEMAREPDSFLTGFRRGLIANSMNPKVVLFFLAFLPQFVSPNGWATPWQLGVLGLLFALCAALVFGAISLGAGSIGGLLRRRPAIRRWLDAVAGLIFIGLALRLLGTDIGPARS